jgi:alpha-tubulin suppressor-like RCC1 family protein
MPVTYPGTQYSGVWTIPQVNDAKAAGTWPIAYNSVSLLTWGSNSFGKLGLNNTTSYSSPKSVGSEPWSVISSGDAMNASVKLDGTLWTWGYNNYAGGGGALGHNNTTSYSSPKQVGTGTGWATVSADSYGYTTAAIKTDGTMWCWGYGAGGQMGDGTTDGKSSPKQVGALTNWSKVYVGSYTILAIKTDGTLWGWGFNGSGQLGLGDTTHRSSPTQIGGGTTWRTAIVNNGASFAIKTDNSLWGWGNNTYGQLGVGNTTNYSSPKQLTNTNWASIGGGIYHVAAVTTSGQLWAWGYGPQGRLGLNNTTSYSNIKQVGALTNWGPALPGGNINIKTNSQLWMWGKNGSGELGLGDTANISSPVQIGSLTNWLAAASCYSGTIATAS